MGLLYSQKTVCFRGKKVRPLEKETGRSFAGTACLNKREIQFRNYRRSITLTPLYFDLSKANVLASTGTFGVNCLMVNV